MRTLLIGALVVAAPLGAAARNPHFPVAAEVAERRLANDAFEIVGAKPTAGGVAGAQRLKLRFVADGREVLAKWKAAPRWTAEGWNNTPRKEIAAYAVQKLFLEPDDYVVPPVVGRCITLDRHAEIDPSARPTLPNTTCVFGALSLWIVGVEQVDEVIDLERFERDPRYARRLGDVNLLGYLTDHRDGRTGNFLISTDPSDPRLFSVDNGVSFAPKVFNYFVPNLNRIRVPALPRRAVERLRALEPGALEHLAVLGELAAGEGGVLRPVAPGPNWAPKEGTRIGARRLQLGLSRRELRRMRARIEALLARVAEGEIELR